ncbi:ArsR/SmtB family transcription factor [Bacillus solimangrovi]|uniref:Transcriptional regulator n=1 Tax=Bacillus solimangrovi TaxID=1305675 RepID=A0A1E5LDW3_9BACI|nr:metalloregulator ArsR/SmtB family transcription factor [Bacillus solimangrovi]OEH92266.1 transcriptional regulator [Bacillus solimangrovi]
MGDEAIKIFRDCIPLFQTLSDPYRQDIVLMLAEQERLTVNEIVEQVTLSRPAVSHHLKILRDTGLVTSEKNGTKHYYSLNLDSSIEKLKRLILAIEEDC